MGAASCARARIGGMLASVAMARRGWQLVAVFVLALAVVGMHSLGAGHHGATTPVGHGSHQAAAGAAVEAHDHLLATSSGMDHHAAEVAAPTVAHEAMTTGGHGDMHRVPGGRRRHGCHVPGGGVELACPGVAAFLAPPVAWAAGPDAPGVGASSGDATLTLAANGAITDRGLCAADVSKARAIVRTRLLPARPVRPSKRRNTHEAHHPCPCRVRPRGRDPVRLHRQRRA